MVWSTAQSCEANSSAERMSVEHAEQYCLGLLTCPPRHEVDSATASVSSPECIGSMMQQHAVDHTGLPPCPCTNKHMPWATVAQVVSLLLYQEPNFI